MNLTTTVAGSLVVGAGFDWKTPTAHTAKTGQSLLHELATTASNGSTWAQRVDAGTANAGDQVSVGLSTPTNLAWNLAAAEITPASTASSALAYDGHGNTTMLGGQHFGYDGADRHMSTTLADGSTITWARDAGDRIVSRTVTGPAALRTGEAPLVRYGYTAGGDTPDVTLTAAGVLAQRIIPLPGGVVLTTTYPTGTSAWAYPNIHGDVIATADAAGTATGPLAAYDPFGQPINPTTGEPAGLPDTTTGLADDGWLGQHQRLTDHTTATPVTEMGARLYLPTLGRFLSIDPVDGGSANDYDYCNADPVGCTDLDGNWGFKIKWKKLLKRVATVTAVVAAGACIVATGGICTAVTVAAVAASAAWNGYRAYNHQISWRSAITNVGVDAISLAFRPVRSYKYLPRHVATGPGRHVAARAVTRTFGWAAKHHPYRTSIRTSANIFFGYRGYSNGW